MSSNHKAPLAAFVVVAIACVVVLATNSMRSYARDAWRDFAAPVVGGLALLPSTTHHDATPPTSGKTATVDEAVAPADPVVVTTTPRPHRGVHRAHHASTLGTATAPSVSPASTVSATNAASTVPTPPSPTPQHGAFGGHRGWGQGQRNGWTYGQHGGAPSFANTAASGHGSDWGTTGPWHGNGTKHGPSAPKSSKSSTMTHGPSWKTAKTYASSSLNRGQGAKGAPVKMGSSHGSNSGHGYGYGYAGKANHGRGR